MVHYLSYETFRPDEITLRHGSEQFYRMLPPNLVQPSRHWARRAQQKAIGAHIPYLRPRQALLTIQIQ